MEINIMHFLWYLLSTPVQTFIFAKSGKHVRNQVQAYFSPPAGHFVKIYIFVERGNMCNFFKGCKSSVYLPHYKLSRHEICNRVLSDLLYFFKYIPSIIHRPAYLFLLNERIGSLINTNQNVIFPKSHLKAIKIRVNFLDITV